jgi:hypothetical protein
MKSPSFSFAVFEQKHLPLSKRAENYISTGREE